MEGFKKLIKVLIVAAIGFGYHQWPKRCIRNFEAAILAGDVEKAKEMIDMEALQKSMAEQAEEAAVAALAGKKGAPSEDQIRSMVRSNLNSPQGKAELNPDAMVRAMIASAKAHAHKSNMEGSPTWEGPFSVSVRDVSGDSRAIFRFRGLNGWKLAGFEIGKGDMKRFKAGGSL
jgi:hypothetical protein